MKHGVNMSSRCELDPGYSPQCGSLLFLYIFSALVLAFIERGSNGTVPLIGTHFIVAPEVNRIDPRGMCHENLSSRSAREVELA